MKSNDSNLYTIMGTMVVTHHFMIKSIIDTLNDTDIVIDYNALFKQAAENAISFIQQTGAFHKAPDEYNDFWQDLFRPLQKEDDDS